MELIDHSIEFAVETPVDREGCLKLIERAGRTCYKSEGKITLDSAEKFVKKLVDAGHLAMIEHSNWVYRGRYDDPMSYLASSRGMTGGNLRAWMEAFNLTMDDISHLHGFVKQEDIPDPLRRYTAKFILSRAIANELVRHRPCSFAQESTRYVRYADGITCILPDSSDFTPDQLWTLTGAYADAERAYRQLLDQGVRPEIARDVLPLGLKTELVITADRKEWRHIYKLRADKAAHPDVRDLMNRLAELWPWIKEVE